MRIGLLAFSLLTLLSPTALATGTTPELKRDLLQGRALQKDGTAWTDAKIFVYGAPHDRAELAAQTFRLETKSDARGRFRLRVPRSHRFVIWALGAETDGTARCSNAVVARSGYIGLELTDTGESLRTLRRIRIPDLYHGLKVQQACILIQRIHIPLAIGEDRIATVKGWPISDSSRVTLLGEDGAVLVRENFAWTQRDKAGEFAPDAPFAWPEPEGEPVLIRIHSDGKDVAGARIHGGQGASRGIIGVTDERGRAIIRIGGSRNSGNKRANFAQMIRVEPRQHVAGSSYVTFKLVERDEDAEAAAKKKKAKEKEKAKQANKVVPGAAMILGRVGARATEIPRGRDAAALLKDGEPDVEFEVSESVRLRGRLLFAEGRPAAKVALLCHTSLQALKQQNGMMIFSTSTANSDTMIVRTDEEGRFEVSSLRPGGDLSLQALWSAADTAAASEACAAEVLPHAFVHVGKIPDEAGVKDLGDLRVDQLARLSIAVRAASGAAARFGDLMVSGCEASGSRQHQSNSTLHVLRTELDRRGRAVVLYPRATQCDIACSAGIEVAAVEVKIETEASALRDLPLTLKPALQIRGRVVDAAGNGVQGVTVSRTQMHARGSSLLLQALQSSAKSDEEGRFEIPVLANAQYWLFAHAQFVNQGAKVAQRLHQNLQVQVGDESPQPVELTLNIPKGAKLK